MNKDAFNYKNISIPNILKKVDLRFIVLGRLSKKPIEKNWTSDESKQYSYDDKKLNTMLKLGYNYGVLLGKNGYFVVDFDHFSQKELGQILLKLPKTLVVKTRSGGYHLYYKSFEPVSTIHIKLENSKGIDIQGKNAQVVGPNSIVPKEDGTDGKYEIIIKNDIATTNLMEIFIALDSIPEVHKNSTFQNEFKKIIQKQIPSEQEQKKIQNLKDKSALGKMLKLILKYTQCDDRGTYFLCHCPIHKPDNKPSLVIFPHTFYVIDYHGTAGIIKHKFMKEYDWEKWGYKGVTIKEFLTQMILVAKDENNNPLIKKEDLTIDNLGIKLVKELNQIPEFVKRYGKIENEIEAEKQPTEIKEEIIQDELLESWKMFKEAEGKEIMPITLIDAEIKNTKEKFKIVKTGRFIYTAQKGDAKTDYCIIFTNKQLLPEINLVKLNTNMDFRKIYETLPVKTKFLLNKEINEKVLNNSKRTVLRMILNHKINKGDIDIENLKEEEKFLKQKTEFELLNELDQINKNSEKSFIYFASPIYDIDRYKPKNKEDIESLMRMSLFGNGIYDEDIELMYRMHFFEFNAKEHRYLEAYAPHSIIITNTGTGKTTLASQIGKVIDFSNASSAGIFGYGTGDTVHKGILNNLQTPLFIDETGNIVADEVSEEQQKILIRLFSLLRIGKSTIGKGAAAGMNVHFANDVVFQGNAQYIKQETQMIPSLSTITNYINNLKPESADIAALRERIPIVFYKYNAKRILKQAYENKFLTENEKELLLELMKQVKYKYSSVFAEMVTLNKVIAWLETPPKEYVRLLDERITELIDKAKGEFSDSYLYDMSFEFFKHSGEIYKRLKGAALRLAINSPQTIYEILNSGKFITSENINKIIAMSNDYLGKIYDLMMRSVDNIFGEKYNTKLYEIATIRFKQKLDGLNIESKIVLLSTLFLGICDKRLWDEYNGVISYEYTQFRNFLQDFNKITSYIQSRNESNDGDKNMNKVVKRAITKIWNRMNFAHIDRELSSVFGIHLIKAANDEILLKLDENKKTNLAENIDIGIKGMLGMSLIDFYKQFLNNTAWDYHLDSLPLIKNCIKKIIQMKSF